MYGLTSRYELEKHVENVVRVIGGGEPARLLLLETAAAETDVGNAIDKSWSVGVGLMQFDEIAFRDVKQRTSRAIKEIVMQKFGVDIDRATHFDLRYSPLLSVLFARLKYRLVPAAIPVRLEDRAAYWKKWYNSELGAGTTAHYIGAAVRNGIV